MPVSHYDVRGTGTQQRDSCTDGATVKTLTPQAGAAACLISVETTDARMTFDGSAPTATNGHVVKAGQQPLYLPFAPVVKWIGVSAAASIVNHTSLQSV